VKWDPPKVALDMEILTNNGNYVFNNDECLTQGQIKSYFSRLVTKRRTTNPTSDQQATSGATPSSSTSTTTNNTVNTRSKRTIDEDESTDDEEIDERDLEIYSWRNVLDEARDVIDRSTNATATTSASTTPTTKRKLVVNTSKQNKHENK
jgi:hypothetical protein